MFNTKLVGDLFISNKSILRQFTSSQQHVSLYPKLSPCHMFHETRHHIHHTATSTKTIIEDQLNPFSLVSDDLSLLAAKMRSMVAAEFPKVASGAEYFFKLGAERKHFCPTALLLMATALNMPVSQAPARVANSEEMKLQQRLKLIAEITELIHVRVGSLLHGDFVDCSKARIGFGSLSSMLGNKLAVLFGDFLLSRAYVSLASLENTEVLSLLGEVVEHRAIGETMQMTTSAQCLNMQHYMEKTYYKRASLISSSCKAIALLAGQSTEVATFAYDYGKNLGLAHQLTKDVLDFTGSTSRGKASLSDIRNGIITAPLLFAIEEFPQLREVVHRGFDNSTDVDLALDYLGRSRGIQRAKDLALEHATKATEAIDSLPFNDDENVRRSRRALIDLTVLVIER